MLLALSQSAVFLVVSVNDRPGAAQRVLDVVSDVNGLVRAVGFRQIVGDAVLCRGVRVGVLGPDQAGRVAATGRAAPVPGDQRGRA